MNRSPALAARRLFQTVSTFENGPRVLWDITRRTDVLEVRTKGGLTITCPNVPGARVPLYELFAEDTYRIRALTTGLPADLVALDVGGHIGCFSTALAQAVPGATVHTFEASPATAGFLQRNITANHLDDRVHPHFTALSDHHGTLRFAASSVASGLNGVTNPDGDAHVVDVPCITFAEAVAAAGGHVDLVKMDVEGSEYEIVLGSTPQDWATVQRVAIEFHGVPGRHWHELRAFFASAGLALTASDFGSEGYGMLWFNREAR